jgi:transposase
MLNQKSRPGLNKTDENDAEGLAQIMRTGWYRPVHVKSLNAHRASSSFAFVVAGGAAGQRRKRSFPRAPHAAKIQDISTTLT